MYSCPYLVFICNITTTCVATEFPFPCLSELLLLIDSSKLISGMNPAPFGSFSYQGTDSRRLKRVLKCKKKNACRLSLHCRFQLKELSPNRFVHITECGLMTDELRPLWISFFAASPRKKIVTTLIQICTLYRNGCFF